MDPFERQKLEAMQNAQAADYQRALGTQQGRPGEILITDRQFHSFSHTARSENKSHRRTDALISIGIVAAVWVWFAVGLVALADLCAIVAKRIAQ